MGRVKGSGRPYPKDIERMTLVRIELAKNLMTVAGLSVLLKTDRAHLSKVISGVRRSPKTEVRIAEFFGKERDELFPPRNAADIQRMRQAGREAQGQTLGDAA